MEIDVIEKKDNELVFVLKKTNAAFANTVRRLAMEDVPVMAIEDVEFRKNSSVLYDEVIAHRLGLIPLKTDLSSYNLPEKCKCDGAGCARCQLKMTLNAAHSGMVYADELKSKDPKIKPVQPKMPIIKLLKDQSLIIEATAQLGKGKTHVKWSPGLVYYKQRPEIVISKDIKNPEKVVERCPQGVFEIKSGKLVINKSKVINCHLCGECEELTESSIKIEKTDDYVFYVESWGQLTPKEIISAALDILQEKTKEFEKELEKIK